MLKRLNGSEVNSSFNRVIEYLELLPAETVVTTAELSEQTGFSTDALKNLVRRHSEITQRTIKIGSVQYWGSLATIQKEKHAENAQAS